MKRLIAVRKITLEIWDRAHNYRWQVQSLC